MTVVQPQYHMLDRYIEHEIVETCDATASASTPFSPLAQGLLTGKYRKGQPLPAGSRATWQADRQINDLLTEENLDKVEELRKVADGLGLAMPVLAPGVDSAPAGHQLGDRRRQQAQSARHPTWRPRAWSCRRTHLAEIDRILGFHRFERHIG